MRFKVTYCGDRGAAMEFDLAVEMTIDDGARPTRKFEYGDLMGEVIEAVDGVFKGRGIDPKTTTAYTPYGKGDDDAEAEG